MTKSRRKSKKWAVIILVVSAAALTVTYAVRNPGAAAADEITPVRGDITTYYSFSGIVQARSRENILADRLMQAAEIFAEPGQAVQRGDALLETSSGQIIRAGIAGEVSSIYVEENAQVLPGGRLVDIIDYSDLQLRIKVDEFDLAALEVGKEAAVTVNALDKEVEGVVVHLSREGIYANGMTFFDAVISLEADEAVRVGMSAEARVINQSVRDVIILPMDAIQFDENNEPYALIRAGRGPGSRRKLTLGLTDGVNVEVREGIALADVVLAPGQERERSFGPGRVHSGPPWD